MRRVSLGLGVVLISALVATGCDNYTYFTVHAGLDSASVGKETRDAIGGCHLVVLTGDGTVIEENRSLRVWNDDTREYVEACQLTRTPWGEWGTFNYSSARESGELRFVIKMFTEAEKMNNNPIPFVQGASELRSLAPGAEVGKTTGDRIDVFGKSCMPAGCKLPTEPLSNGTACTPDCKF